MLADSYGELAHVFPPSFGDDLSLDDWAQMRMLMLRCAEHLTSAADPAKPSEKVLRRAAVMSLLTLVRYDTGRPQYPLLSTLLLRLVNDTSLTPGSLRKMSSRAGVPKKRPLRRRLPRRRQSSKGRPAFKSGDKEAQRWRQAQIAVGNWTDQSQGWS